MNSECDRASDAAAYLADELSELERLQFAMHMAGCGHCRDAVESSERLIARLRTVPEIGLSRDLTPLILERIREPEYIQPHFFRWSHLGALAATITIIAGTSLLWKRETPMVSAGASTALVTQSAASVDRALDWFCKNQEADGSWNATKWGGNPRFQIALTALPVIALLEAPRPTPEHIAAANRAVAFLLKQQNADGSFGDYFRQAPYLQSVTTLALLHAYEREPSPELHRAIDAALKVVKSSQTADGGWGYPLTTTPTLPITLWHRDVVSLAAKLGWGELNPSVERAVDWIESQPSPTGAVAENLSEISADYHRAYFIASNLRDLGTAEATEHLSALRQELLSQQSQSGAEAGTWAPRDQWSRAGGRIYSTALALLALR